MAIHHWDSLAEAEKLTQSQLIPGVIEEDIKRNGLLDVLPVAQATGKSIKWNRESATVESNVVAIDIGDELAWSSGVTYSQQEVSLKRYYVQRILDDFIPEVYTTVNDYRAQCLLECKKGMVRKLNSQIIYGDTTYSAGNKEMDGLHAWAALQNGTSLDIDNLEAGLSLRNMRTLYSAMKYGMDFWYVPTEIAQRIDEAYEERGLAQLATGTSGSLSMITRGIDSAGQVVTYFMGKPIVRTDYLVAEQANTGVGSNARAAYSSGDKQYSIFAIKLGNVFKQEPGLTFGFGNTKNVGDFYKLVLFDELEDYDAEGLRLVNYSNLLLGSKLCLGRIYDIEDAAVTA
jgi:hypothetical protein